MDVNSVKTFLWYNARENQETGTDLYVDRAIEPHTMMMGKLKYIIVAARDVTEERSSSEPHR